MDIKIILERNCYSDEQKAKMICEFMTWDYNKLLSKMKNIGTGSDEQQSMIIESLWGRQ